jgi:hypothetical protein
MECQKPGHFAKVCKTHVKQSKMNLVQQTAASEESPENNPQMPHAYFGSLELGSVNSINKGNKSVISVDIDGHTVKVKADTGAEATVIPYHLYKAVTRKPLQKIQQPPEGLAGNKSCSPSGMCASPNPIQTPYY